jgi:hypothetical protein
VTAEHISQGSLFSTDFLQESIARVADWQLLTDAEIDALAADLRAIFNKFPTAKTPNESQTEDDLCCQPVAFIMAAIVVPLGCLSRARTASCLVPLRVEPKGMVPGFAGLFARLLARAILAVVGVLLCDI